MPTIATLIKENHIERIDPPLSVRQEKWRCLYGTNDFIEWMKTTLPDLEHGYPATQLTALEQVANLFIKFVSGHDFCDDRRFKPLNSNPDHHVWEMKTPAVRIFGWAPQQDHFICAYGELKENLIGDNHRRVSTLIAQTKYAREQIGCTENDYVASRKYRDVIST